MRRTRGINYVGARRIVANLITEYSLQHQNLLPKLMGVDRKL
jgi:hypothetical protein